MTTCINPVWQARVAHNGEGWTAEMRIPFAQMRFENRERRNKQDFAVGQTLTTLRPYSYGNLRDSDPEKAIYRFADSAYGNRVGQSYPLWNWCVLFNHFPISER